MHLHMRWLMAVLWTACLLCCACAPTEAAANRKARKCLQVAESGRCFGYVPSYAYNPLKRKCETFIYGGCGGNENRFQTMTECTRNCRDI